MRILLVYVIAIFCLNSVSPAQSDAETETQLLATLHKMYAAEKKHDLNFIHSYFSDDFAEVGGDARVYVWKDIEGSFADMELREYKRSDCVTLVLVHKEQGATNRIILGLSEPCTPGGSKGVLQKARNWPVFNGRIFV